MPGDPFQIDSLPNTPLLRSAMISAARPLLSWLLGLRTYRQIYRHTQLARGGGAFDVRALDALDIRPNCSPADVASIPKHGPLVVASNHPHGVVDGLLLASVIRRARPDVRIMANHLLARIPELADLCFFVDPFGGAGAATRSRSGLRAAHRWLRTGGALIAFPAGEVAHIRRPDGSYADSPWLSTVGRMAVGAGADVIPAFIAGTNTRWFHTAGRIHASLRTALLPRELLHLRGQEVSVRLGPLLAAGNLVAHGDMTATHCIRDAVEHLRVSTTASGRTDVVFSDIERLPADACLVESGTFQVFYALASQIPSALREIGRLREETYRAVGEGTGRTLDLDAFDDRYLHLFSWDRSRRQIVGAYRIGRTDQITARHGVNGLYTRTLFRYDQRLIARLSPALELGRSFVRTEYQKNYNALLLLWKGIGRFIVRHPEYRVLFGTVSISARYADCSHDLLKAFLLQNHLDRDLAQLVEAVNPDRPHRPHQSHGGHLSPHLGLSVPPSLPTSIDEVNRLVAGAESDGKGVPILLRQYLKLNARLIGFNVDPNFGDALDALMMVDLAVVDPAILSRYLGREDAARFLARHHRDRSAHAA